MTGDSGPNFGINVPGESPYRRENIKEVTEDINEKRNFEVCEPKESIIEQGRIRKRKKVSYVHLKNDEDGLKWTVLIVPPDGEPDYFEYPA